MVTTPVLLLIFNRPEKTEQLIKHLSGVKPQKIYIGADGPRTIEEEELTNLTRSVIKSHITWDCEIKTLYRNENLGLRVAVSQAIDWFFDHESAGIILEDDCLPDATFFEFCAELLDYYKENEEIMHISALNSFPRQNIYSYHFSIYPRVWGWATWRRAWKKYDDNPAKYTELIRKDAFKKCFDSAFSRSFWKLMIEKLNIPNSKLRFSSWGYYWILSIRANHGLCITPKSNLVQNIGFDEEATNTTSLGRLSRLIKGLNLESLTFPLVHPDRIIPSKQDDEIFLRRQLIDTPLKRFKVVLKMIFPFLRPFK